VFKQHREKHNIYIGEMIGDARDGKGKNIWANGDVYEGDWLED